MSEKIPLSSPKNVMKPPMFEGFPQSNGDHKFHSPPEYMGQHAGNSNGPNYHHSHTGHHRGPRNDKSPIPYNQQQHIQIM